MHTPARKLKSTRGASMLFALLVFLLCLLAGTAALTAAAANAGRYTHQQSEQQRYFSVASALGLLQSDLDALAAPASDTLKVTVTCVETRGWDNTTPTPTTTGPTYVISSITPASNLNYFQWLLLQNNVPAEWQSDLDRLVPAPTRPTWSNKTFTISPGTGLEDTLCPVNVTVTSDGYTLEMDLSADDSGDGTHRFKAIWAGKADVETTVNTATTGTTATAGTRTTTTTLTCTLQWPKESRTVLFD